MAFSFIVAIARQPAGRPVIVVTPAEMDVISLQLILICTVTITMRKFTPYDRRCMVLISNVGSSPCTRQVHAYKVMTYKCYQSFAYFPWLHNARKDLYVQFICENKHLQGSKKVILNTILITSAWQNTTHISCHNVHTYFHLTNCAVSRLPCYGNNGRKDTVVQKNYSKIWSCPLYWYVIVTDSL